MSEIKNNWCIALLSDLLDYEQPTNYIVENTNYDDAYNTPVLTAGKSFLLGYTNETKGIFNNLPVIIFDDFTTAIKFVNFPFKVKSSAMKILKPKNSLVNIKYVYYFMETLRLNVDSHKRYWISVGALQKIPLPPLPEQHRIVAKIEELFSELDKGIETLKKAQQQLKVYRQAVLKYAFEGKLTNPEVKDGELPEGWEYSTLGRECTFSQGIQIDVNFQSEIKKENQVRFLRIVDFTQGDEPERYIDHPGEKYYLKKDEIAMVRYGTVGFVCTGKEGVIANNLFKIIPSTYLNRKYLIHFLKSEFFRSKLETKGATMQALSFGLIKPIIIPKPPIVTQEIIVQEIESRLSVCDNIEASIEQSLQQSEALRQSILKKAFEGKLVPQDPNDEPASVLLERIRAERAASGTKPTRRRKNAV
jgi:type I restriction enzyme S subunit